MELFNLAVAILMLAVGSNAKNSYFIAAPSVFRIDVEETIYLRFDYKTSIELLVQDPRSSKVVSRVNVNLDPDKTKVVRLKVKAADMPESWSSTELQYKLVAKGPSLNKETSILIDLKRGTVLIQTDKPIYTPGEKVKYRIIPVDMDLLPLKEKVMMEIKNPKGVLVRRKRNLETWKKGFHVGEFSLGDIPVLGTWRMTAFFSMKNSRNSSSTFVVKKYVLPTFRVQVRPPPFIARSRKLKRFPFKVIAKYSYGKFVKGLVRLQTFIMGRNGRKDILIDDQKSAINGEESFTIDYEKLSVPKEVSSVPFGERIKIIAEVTERATGTKEVAIDASVQIVKIPFTISFEKTMKYFKPGIVFDVGVTVRYPDRQPVKNHELKYEYTYREGRRENKITTDNNGDAFFRINTPPTPDPITIKVSTTSKTYENEEKEFKVNPYSSLNDNYISVRPYKKNRKATKFKVGSDIDIEFWVVSKNKEIPRTINYMVIAKGKIVYYKSFTSQTETSTSQLAIAPNMAPKCRIVAFYVQDGEAVSDSVLLDIEDEFENKVVTLASPDDSGRFTPGSSLRLDIKTESKSTVGLLSVDESVYYLRNESRLTNEKVFSEMSKFDLGCGLGSGKDNTEVFENAGLSVITNSALPTKQRTGLVCPTEKRSRQRRSLSPENIVEKCCKADCCRDFYSSRERLAAKVVCDTLKSRVKKSCWKEFLSCCQKMLETRGRTIESDNFAHGQDQIHMVDESQIQLRDNFPQSWMWFDLETSEDGKLQRSYTIPDSITTWEITALAINNKTGLGLSEPLKIKSDLDIFAHIKMPYSAQRYEQITVYAVIYNYYRGRTKANIYLKGHETFCSIAEAGKNSPIVKVEILANDGIAIPFTIIPLHIGEIPIEFVVNTETDSDRILKKLTVVPEGVEEEVVRSILLDPQGIKKDTQKQLSGSFEQKNKHSQVNSETVTLPDQFIPESQKAMVYVTGNLMSAGVEDVIENGLANLIKLPTGCGEQTMIKMAPLVYVLRYLYSTKNGVTADVERKAYNFMRKGYNNELRWRRDDNSYSVWGNRTPASTWLSAFVNKVFCQATRYIKDDIDNNVLCDTLKFLENIQASDGSFPEGYPVRHREMIGGVASKLSLTAFVLISLMECNSQCIKADSRVIIEAGNFLNSQLSGITSGYIMSLVSYALAITNNANKAGAYMKLKRMLSRETKDGRERNYIKDGGPALQVESTAYTLLTMAALNKLDDAGPVVVWLTEHRNSRGSFYSTQDTVIALQALSEYCSKTAGSELDLRVTVTASNKDVRKTFFVSNENALVRQEFEITQAIPGRITVDTVGTGTAQLQIEWRYNKPQRKNENCEYIVEVETMESSDNLVNDATEIKKWQNDKTYKSAKQKQLKKCKKRCKKRCKKNKKCRRKCVKGCKKKVQESQQGDQVTNRIDVKVCLSHKFSNGSSMTIAEVGILTGFKANEESVKKLLSSGRDPKIDNYEINDRFLVLYLQKIRRVKSCFTFTLNKVFEVGVLQSVPVVVYDYYEPETKCTQFYGPKADSQLLKTICNGNECVCIQDKVCSEERSFIAKELKTWACQRSDFVILGEVRDIQVNDAWRKITLRIKRVYKKGKKDFVTGRKIDIYQSKSCSSPSLHGGTKLVLMLKEKSLLVLNKDAFVLKWPANVKKISLLEQALEEVRLGHYCG